MPPEPPSFRHLGRAGALPFVLGLLAAIGCYVSAGPTLGLYLGGVFVLALIAPALCAGQATTPWALVRVGAAIDGIAAGWLLSLGGSITVVQWACGYAILIAFGLALCGAVRFLERIGIGVLAASAITCIVALLWLSWPVWLAVALRGPAGPWLVRWLVPAHPLLAMNHVIRQQGIWLQSQVIYPHVTLGQDIAYELPGSIFPAVGVHLLLAAGLMLLARRRESAERLLASRAA